MDSITTRSMDNIGVTYPSDIDKNVATLSGDLAYTNEDRALLGRFCREAYDCEIVKSLKVT